MYQNPHATTTTTTTTTTRSRGGSFSRNLSDKHQVSSSPVYSPSNSASIRETGIIDKLMQSFGFITCCERNESIFFHFSQYSGSSSDLNSGDEVEFEVGTDTRTSKLIARRLVRLPTGTVSFESISEGRLLGKLDCEPKVIGGGVEPGKPSKSYNDPGMGRIIYERNGEFFFVPYSFTDVNDEREIHKGDEVSFYMAKNKRTGALRARLVRLVQPAKIEMVQGVVKTLKDSFGFIERADMIKDIFFHYSELSTGIESDIEIGSCVEFVIQNRQGKEVATHIKILTPGSVQFDDVNSDQLRGAVKNPVIRSFTHGHGKEAEPTPGLIIYQSEMEGMMTLPYTDKDQLGDYTMLPGDIVLFNLAIDRRNWDQHATNVTLHRLIEDQKDRTGREQGIVAALRDGFGFIRCAQRDLRMFFHFNEVINLDHKLSQFDEVEFSVQNDYTNERLHAVRIKILQQGTVKFEVLTEEVYHGTVEEELTIDCSRNQPGPLKLQGDGSHGTIRFLTASEDVEMVKFYWSPEPLQFGDQVQFRIAKRTYDHLIYAVEIEIEQTAKEIRFRGFIATLKDSYGFIESEEHDCELFFPFSSCYRLCDPRDLSVMDEVEYCIVRRSGRLAADEVMKLPKGTIETEETKTGSYEGVVVRPMKSTDSALDYEGTIQVIPTSTSPSNDSPPQGEDNSLRSSSPQSVPSELPFSATSIAGHRITLQNGDAVQFQIGVNRNSQLRALNITTRKEFIRGTIESVKGQYGFITLHHHEQNENGFNHQDQIGTENGNGTGGSVFFHMKSLAMGCDFSDLHSSDEVEFLLVTNNKAKKNSAIHVKKLSANVRPERLMRKQKSINSQFSVQVLRQPKGPDGSRGFKQLPENSLFHNTSSSASSSPINTYSSPVSSRKLVMGGASMTQ